MLEKKQTIVVERVGNGFHVMPLMDSGGMMALSDVYVFQDMGYASAARDHQDQKDTLLGFIAQHFE